MNKKVKKGIDYYMNNKENCKLLIYRYNERLKFDYDENDRVTLLNMTISALKRKHHLSNAAVNELREYIKSYN